MPFREPQDAHSRSGIARAAENGIVEKEQNDRRHPAIHDAGIARPGGDGLRTSPHQHEQISGEHEGRPSRR